MNDPSRYKKMTTELRASLADETDCLYFVHTPIGIINVSSWNYLMSGFVAVAGEDESKKTRLLVFSEEEMCSFPLEVKRKKLHGKKDILGFNPHVQEAQKA